MKHVITTLYVWLVSAAALSDSAVAQNKPVYPVLRIGSSWQSLNVGPTSETVISTISASPGGNQIEGVLAFADGPIADIDDAAVILRFSPGGVIDALDGNTYRAVTVLPYAAGETYEFRVVVDVPQLHFDAYVTPLGEAPVQIADGYSYNQAARPVLQISEAGFRAATGWFALAGFSPQVHSNYEEVSVKTVYTWSPGGGPHGTVHNVTPTPYEGWYGTACIHPHGTDVVFPGAAWGYSRIWKYSFATGEVVPLTSTAFPATQPSYSADGKSITFMSDMDFDNPRFDMFEVGRTLDDSYGFQGGITGGSSLYVMDADGSNIRRITFEGDDIIDKRPSFHPDGKTVVFHSTREPNPLYTLYMWTVPADGSWPATRVQLNGNPWVGRPRYSSDGTEIFFFTGVTNGQYDQSGRHTLCRVAAAGGAWTPVAKDTVGLSSHGPDPDPDGLHLWYHAYDNGLWGIYKLPLSGSGSPVRFSHPSFLPLHTAHATVASNGFLAFDSRTYLDFP